MTDPPVEDGANQVTTAAVGFPRTETCWGTLGGAAGVPEVADEAALAPIAFVARSLIE